MTETIIDLLKWIVRLIAEWPQRKTEAARRKYAIWRATVELRKDLRNRRADLLNSTDKLLKKTSDKLP